MCFRFPAFADYAHLLFERGQILLCLSDQFNPLFEGLHGQIPWGYIMAASTIASLPLVILAVFFQKYVIQDVTRGALKG